MSITVEFAYAEADVQFLLTLELTKGATAADALSAARPRIPVSLPEAPALGVWGKVVDAGRVLNDGDRVEVYRPLQRDPKDARRARALNAT